VTRPGLIAGTVSSLRPRLGRAWLEWRNEGRRRAAMEALEGALVELASAGGLPSGSWGVQRVLPTETDVTVALLGPVGGVQLGVGRIAEPGHDGADLIRNAEVLAELAADERLGEWRAVIPVPLAHGTYRGRAYAVETLQPGAVASRWLARPTELSAVVAAGTAAIGKLHRATAHRATVDDAVLDRVVERPLAVLQAVGARHDAEHAPAVAQRLHRHLEERLRGRACATARTHGDYWLGNLLVRQQESGIEGIVDWGAARADGLPVQDLHHLLLTTRACRDRVPMGRLVVAALEGSLWTPEERRLLGTAGWSWPTGPADDPALTLMTWLDHVASVVAKRPAYGADRRWKGTVVDPVLRAL
jgi:aminoglycoside phosphotransferase